MRISAIVTKIKSLEAQERRMAREDLIPHRRNLATWYSRLAQEIPATKKRRMHEIDMLLNRGPDAEHRWRLILEKRKLVKELAGLDVQVEIRALLDQ